MIELVDYNEIYGRGAETKQAPAKRTRRAGGRKKAATTETATPDQTQGAGPAEPAPSTDASATEA
jgi:large subunit ribosomal protein L17